MQTHKHLAMLWIGKTARGLRLNSNTHKTKCKHHDLKQMRPMQDSGQSRDEALSNPITSIVPQKSHPYTGNLNRETYGDGRNSFPHCEDVLASARP